MLGILELKKLNASWANRIEMEKKETVATSKGVYILVAYVEGGRTYYKGKGSAIVYDQKMVHGWDEDEFETAKEAAKVLQGAVALNTKVAVDRR